MQRQELCFKSIILCITRKYRQDSTSAVVEDVEAFLKEQQASKSKATNLFARQNWEE